MTDTQQDEAHTSEPFRVIVVDDDDHLLKVVARELTGSGFVCATEDGGEAALKALSLADFDVALVDLDMPVIDGFQMLAAMRINHPSTIPVVLTGIGDIPRAVRAMKLGAYDFLEKPCNPHLLERAVRRACEYRRSQQHARKMETEAANSQAALQREQASSQTRKLEAVGRLAAGIAHEINTPTQYIGDNIEFLKSAYENIAGLLRVIRRMMNVAGENGQMAALLSEAGDLAEGANLDYLMSQVPRAIEQSLDGIERITSIVRAMKEFAHPAAPEKTFTDLNQCLRSTITVSRNEWKYVADLRTDLDAGLPPVYCLPGELNQVFLNLIVNAAQAIGARPGAGVQLKGKIVVSTRRDGDWVEVRIADTGAGIPENVRERVFDPFFTTKEVGHGTGQGLAMARNVVVDKHGGTITFTTKTGVGTTFVIRLPIKG